MRKVLVLLTAVLFWTIPFAPAWAIQCVTYARAASGIQLRGDAWQWWSAAEGVYQRGHTPSEGAVLVLARQGHMRHGHVAVVSRMIGPREILVDHANWSPGRGQVARAVRVIDVSSANDWSRVRVWYRPAGQYGNRVYQALGFISEGGGTTHSVAFLSENNSHRRTVHFSAPHSRRGNGGG